jgi:hypothetical protein
MIEAIANLLAAFVAGGLSGLLTPWFAWQVEKRRESHIHRRKLVVDWRQILIPEVVARCTTDDALTGNSFAHYLVSHASFASIKPHLSSAFLKQLDALNRRTVEVDEGPITGLHSLLIDEIARIESSWQLI